LENVSVLSIAGFLIVMLLGIIGWVLDKFYNQQKETHKSNQDQFEKLLEKLDVLNMTMVEHRTDVVVIKEQISNHLEDLKENKEQHDYFYLTLRKHDNDITSIKSKVFGQ
jgi:predicted  nucleic acid-binding Zn-ribbon protein